MMKYELKYGRDYVLVGLRPPIMQIIDAGIEGKPTPKKRSEVLQKLLENLLDPPDAETFRRCLQGAAMLNVLRAWRRVVEEG